MKSQTYKYNIEFANLLLKRDLKLLLEIYDNTIQLGDVRTKELGLEIKEITSKMLKNGASSTLNAQEQKTHEDFINYAFHFNFLALHSLFVFSISTFENHLLEVAKNLENHSECLIKIKDMSKDKSDLDRIRKYLNLVHNLETAKSDNSEWQSIIQFQQIRNLIVHNNNKFKTDNCKKNLVIFLKKYKAHMPREYKFEIEDRNFFLDFNNYATTFSENLANEIYKM